MTDEEKAEEILQTKGSMTFCAKGCGYTEKVKKFITIGIAEGRKEQEKKDKGFCESFCMKDRKENWHDLRKNPDDLPKEKGYYLVAIYGAIVSTISYFNLSEREFNANVIAWCELPKFEE